MKIYVAGKITGILNNWESSRGANMKKCYVESFGKLIFFEVDTPCSIRK